MSEYWREFWDQHVATAGDDPYRQVARTLGQEPMSRAMLMNTAAHFIEEPELEAHHSVLDGCCGNGLASIEMARLSKSVVGVDFSNELIAEMGSRIPNILTGIVGDVLEIKFQPDSSHRIQFAAAPQHFSESRAFDQPDDYWYSHYRFDQGYHG